jgi:cyclophilin family peptidyl-prolyl cis-trans isomerase
MGSRGRIMKRIVTIVLLAAGVLGAPALVAEETPASAPPAAPVPSGPPRVRFDTSMGSFVVKLNAERAPLTAANFLRYVREGYYKGMIFHRVIENFVAQAGGYTADYQPKAAHEPIVNESGNGLTNQRGTIAMARTEQPHTASSQFYVNLVDNPVLDPQQSRWGYAVFGEVVDGMDVIDRIGHTPTGKAGPFNKDAPLKPVVIEKAQLLN